MPVSGSTIVSSADVLDAQIEKVRNKVQELFETSDTAASLVKKGGETEVISQKLYRIPLVTHRGGIYAKFDAQAGDMGSGSGLNTIKVTGGFMYSRYTVEISKQAMDTTAKGEQAVVNAFAYNFKNAMKEIQVYDDLLFHTDGSGKLTNSASATGTWDSGTKTTLTFAAASDTVGIDRLRVGMAVDDYNSAGSVKRSTASGVQARIDHFDWVNKVVYLTEEISSVASTDLLAFAGLSATLASFQSTWPLSGDSFRHGIYYANDNTTSNYFLGLLKSTYTELVPNYVNAASSDISFSHGQQMLDQVIKRRDESAFRGLQGLAHMAQRAKVFDLGQAISEFQRTTGSEKSPDLQFTNNAYTDDFRFCGIPVRIDKRQDKARIDFIIPKLWGRAQLHDAKFHEVQGRTIFESRASTGNLKAAVHFHIVQAYDYYCVDPGAQGYIYGLVVPSGY